MLDTAMALPTRSGVTTAAMSGILAGIPIEIMLPWAMPRSSNERTLMSSVSIKAPVMTFRDPILVIVKIVRVRLLTLSAIAPPGSVKMIIGIAELAINTPDSVNDSVSSQATNARSTICIFIPKNEHVEEINNFR